MVQEEEGEASLGVEMLAEVGEEEDVMADEEEVVEVDVEEDLMRGHHLK